MLRGLNRIKSRDSIYRVDAFADFVHLNVNAAKAAGGRKGKSAYIWNVKIDLLMFVYMSR